MRTGVHCTELFADLLYTLIQVINDNIHEKTEIHLEKLVPVDMFCDSYFNYGVMVNQIPGQDIYSPVKLDLGQGPKQGIAMLVRLTPGITEEREAYAEFAIPKDVFRYFSATIGLCRNIPNYGKAVFQVWVGDKLAFESPPLQADTEPLRITIPLENSRKFTLRVIDARGKNQSLAEFFYPVWLNPTLQ